MQGRKGLPTSVKSAVREFYINSAQEMPDKKAVSKKTGLASMFVDRSLDLLHQQFVKAHPDVNIRGSKFAQLHPRYVKLQQKPQLVGCMCEYCANIQIKLKTLNSHLAAAHLESIKDHYALSELTLCPKQDDQKYHHPKCIARTCKKCGTKKLLIHVDILVRENSKNVEWKRLGVSFLHSHNRQEESPGIQNRNNRGICHRNCC